MKSGTLNMGTDSTGWWDNNLPAILLYNDLVVEIIVCGIDVQQMAGHLR